MPGHWNEQSESDRLYGYLGDWDYNLRLSQRRADAVAQYLIRQGVNPDSVFTEGLGEYGFDQAASERPAANTTERRIVLLEIQAR